MDASVSTAAVGLVDGALESAWAANGERVQPLAKRARLRREPQTDRETQLDRWVDSRIVLSLPRVLASLFETKGELQSWTIRVRAPILLVFAVSSIISLQACKGMSRHKTQKQVVGLGASREP